MNPDLALAHYRFHVMEQWPEGPRKTAGLAAARATVESLNRIFREGPAFVCVTCARKDVGRPEGVENQATAEKRTAPAA